jgi:ribosomal protein L7/L12
MNIDTQTEEFQSFMKKALRYKDLRNMLESDSRITQIKAVREMHGLGLREAKDLVDLISIGADKRHYYKDAKSTYKYDAGNK